MRRSLQTQFLINSTAMRYQVLLIVVLASQAAAQNPEPRECPPISIKTDGWHAQGSTQFGTRFLAPSRYQRQVWESRGSNMPQMDSSDVEDYWPVTSVLWTFSFSTVRGASQSLPASGADYSLCIEPWSGKRGRVERFRTGKMSTGPSTFATPYIVRASWRLASGRLLTFYAAGTDSNTVAEMYGLISTVRFTPIERP